MEIPEFYRSCPLVLDLQELEDQALTLTETSVLQKLFERYQIFGIMAQCVPFSADASHNEFANLPEGKQLVNTFLF